MTAKSTIWVFSLEPIETRYTAQWHEHFPKFLKKNLEDKFNIVQIDGVQKNTALTPGAFLNFSDTNYWKSSQLCNFLEQHNQGRTSANDHFIFTDAWNPTILQIKYMRDLLGFDWKIHGLWHAGSYDSQDFLGRLIGDALWVRHTEKSFFHAIDHNYFATDFHIELFCYNLLTTDVETANVSYVKSGKIVRTGWPMEYMDATLSAYKNMPKRDLVLFPHRIAPEKQVEIFRDLANYLPQYEFVVCQDQQLSKHEYHSLLGQSKIVFSANLQETLGISTCYEGPLLHSIPLAPDRLSYSEIFKNYQEFLYPSEWTENWNQYVANRDQLCHHIYVTMTHYEKRLPQLKKLTEDLTENFFSANQLVKNLKV